MIILAGFGLFLYIYLMPPWSSAVDPTGKVFDLTQEGKASIGLFLLAGVLWVFEVLPIGITSIVIGVMQGLSAIRPAKEAFKDFMDPSVMFILDNRDGQQALAEYILRNAFSEQKITYLKDTGKVLYRSAMTHGCNKKNFEIFTAEEFIAAIT